MKKNRFIEGTLFAYIIILLTKVIGALYVIPFYNIIGKAGGVLYSYAYSVYALFLDASTSGIPTAISLIIAEYNSLKMFNEREFAFKTANKIVSFVSVICFLIMFSFARLFAEFFVSDIQDQVSINSIVLVIRVISFCLLIIPFLSAIRGYLQGNKYVSTSSSSQLIEQAVRVFIALVGSYVAINIWQLDVSVGVAVALSGTVIGGLVAYLVLRLKVQRNKKELMEGVTSYKDSTVTSKEIIKKIFSRAIPVILIAATQNIYGIVDLRLIIKGLHMIGFDADTCQLIGSIAVTWAPKICMIINSIAISMCLSKIPYIDQSFIHKEHEELNNKFNQAVNTILYISIPLAIFICIFKDDIYRVFYGSSVYGGNVLAVSAILSILFCVQMVMDMILQGMKNYKIVFINTGIGLFINAALDIPIILLLNKLNIYPYVGSLIASIIGQSVSIAIIMIGIKKKYDFNYKPILKNLLVMILATLAMGCLAILAKQAFVSSIINNIERDILKAIPLGIVGGVVIIVYILITYFTGTLQEVFGKDFLSNIKNKFVKKNSSIGGE